MSSAKVLKAYEQELAMGRINFGSPPSTASHKATVECNAGVINSRTFRFETFLVMGNP